MKKNSKAYQQGATLLEVMLVLGIGGLLFVMGLKLYQSFQANLQLQQVRDNVDQLFDSASNYYNANCAAGPFSPTGGVVSYPPSAGTVFAVSIPSTLLINGYLSDWNAASPVVDPTSGDLGYVVQLNAVISTVPMPVNACVVLTPGQVCAPIVPTTAIPTTQAQVVGWEVQVAVKLRPQSNISAYSLILGADCTSGSSSPGTVDPCSAGNTSQQYAVWSRTSSQGSIKKGSIYTSSMQLLKQYNLQYTHDQNYELNLMYGALPPPNPPVYYLCGG